MLIEPLPIEHGLQGWGYRLMARHPACKRVQLYDALGAMILAKEQLNSSHLLGYFKRTV
jgi:hypothetical protein